MHAVQKQFAKVSGGGDTFVSSMKRARQTKNQMEEYKKWLESQPEFAQKSSIGMEVRVQKD